MDKLVNNAKSRIRTWFQGLPFGAKALLYIAGFVLFILWWVFKIIGIVILGLLGGLGDEEIYDPAVMYISDHQSD